MGTAHAEARYPAMHACNSWRGHIKITGQGEGARLPPWSGGRTARLHQQDQAPCRHRIGCVFV